MSQKMALKSLPKHQKNYSIIKQLDWGHALQSFLCYNLIMTKLAIMSDLHIDLNQFNHFEIDTLIKTLKSQQITWLHLAGDISNHYYSTSLPFLENMAEHFKITYNLGNHDMLDLAETEIEAKDFQVYDLGDKVFITFHGWYDYSFSSDKTDSENLSFKTIFWFDRRLNRPLSDKDMTEKICHRLEDILSQQTKPIILVMHFVPHRLFTMTHEKFKPFNAFLGSQRFHDIFTKFPVTDVVFGHAHRSYGTQVIDGIRYHSRPLGYIREWDLTIDFVNKHSHLNPTGTWNLSKRYNLVKKREDFKQYLRENLATEFEKSMTIFSLSE